jgi:hypothetical protein
LLVVVACAKRETAPAPTQKVTTSASPISASSTARIDPEIMIADLMFYGADLARCDEIVSHESKRANIEDLKAKAAKSGGKELVLERSCDAATSGKPYQAKCVAGRLTTFYYLDDALKVSDAVMRECLGAGGTWERNTSNEAQRDALERKLLKTR